MFATITSISGPISLYVYKYNDKTYYFFGDQHYGNTNACEQNGIICDHYDNQYENVIIEGTNCTDLGALFHHWFTFNNDYGIKTDFYAETPFTKQTERDIYNKLNIARYNNAQIQLDNKNNNNNNGGDDEQLAINYYNDEQIPVKNNKDDEQIYVNNNNEEKNYTIFPYDDSWLSLVTDIMSPCFLKDKDNCPYAPNVHSHYVDIRYYELGNHWLNTNIFDVTNIVDYINNNLENDNLDMMLDDFELIGDTLLSNAKTIINIYLKPNNYNKNKQILWDIVSQIQDDNIKDLYVGVLNDMDYMIVKRNGVYMNRVAWELQKLSDMDAFIANSVRHYILSTTEDESTRTYDNWKDKLQYLHNHSLDHLLMHEFISFFFNKLIDIGSLVMDTYTLARMFTQNDSKEIIVYAGDYHILNYCDFFDNFLNAKLVFFVENNEFSRCLADNKLVDVLNANKFRVHSYYKEEANKVLKHDIINVGNYDGLMDVQIIKSEEDEDKYEVSFYRNDEPYTKSWTRQETQNFIIQYLYKMGA